RIADAVDVPVIADADTGYGNPLNVMRAVREFERAGAVHYLPVAPVADFGRPRVIGGSVAVELQREPCLSRELDEKREERVVPVPRDYHVRVAANDVRVQPRQELFRRFDLYRVFAAVIADLERDDVLVFRRNVPARRADCHYAERWSRIIDRVEAVFELDRHKPVVVSKRIIPECQREKVPLVQEHLRGSQKFELEPADGFPEMERVGH
ncbi:MAG: hypothetical protein B7Z63_04240, partial [Ignavibacteriae bacterium 37-53-5]